MASILANRERQKTVMIVVREHVTVVGDGEAVSAPAGGDLLAPLLRLGCLVESGVPRHEVLDAPIQRRELRVIRLRNLNMERRVDRDQEVEQVHGVKIKLVTEAHIGPDQSEIRFRRNLAEEAKNRCPDLVLRHSRLGSCSSRSTAARNRPPR